MLLEFEQCSSLALNKIHVQLIKNANTLGYFSFLVSQLLEEIKKLLICMNALFLFITLIKEMR